MFLTDVGVSFVPNVLGVLPTVYYWPEDGLLEGSLGLAPPTPMLQVVPNKTKLNTRAEI